MVHVEVESEVRSDDVSIHFVWSTTIGDAITSGTYVVQLSTQC